MENKLLEEIGLTKGEISVYFALLELGSCTVGPIVDKAKVSSSKVYNILERLTHKGLVSFVIKENTKYFEASPPEQILDYLKEREESISEQKRKIKDILPELELKRKLSKYKNEATVFKGLKGAKTAFDDVLKSLKKGEEYHVLGFTDVSGSLLAFLKNFHRQRSKKGIKVKLLFSEQGKEYAETIKSIPSTEIKFAPSQLLSSSFVLMYNDKVLITVATKDNLTLFKIENKEVADSFRSQFKLIWNQDTIVNKGFKAMSDALYNIINTVDPKKGYSALNACWGTEPYRQKYIDFFKKYHKERMRLKVNAKLLFNPGIRYILEDNKSNYEKYLQYKVMPYKPESPVEVFTTEDKAILIIQEKEPIVITINNKEVSKSFKTNFEALWSISK